MNLKAYRHPILFYVLSTIIPWGLWFLAAYISHLPTDNQVSELTISTLAIAGLCAPMAIAFWLIGNNPSLRQDLKSRLFNLNIRPIYLFLACFLMLGSILLAQGISILLGYSPDQFQLAKTVSFTGGMLPGWFWLFFAPTVEELAWHSYGTDCLRQRMNLLFTSLLFASYWAFWHFPAFFIKDYYHSNLETTGIIYSLNFMVSIIPFVILMNWLYYKTDRNILVIIVFHVSAGVFNELFNTHPDSKIIQTIILTILSLLLIIYNRPFFLKRTYP